jgi:hypothetical protein
MGHFKRGRAKDRRAGCLRCKPHKSNSQKGSFNAQTLQEQKAIEAERPERHWKPRKSICKPWTIEHRVTPESREHWRHRSYRPAPLTWGVYRRYATQTSRDQSLRDLLRKRELGNVGPHDVEYRAGPDPER